MSKLHQYRIDPMNYGISTPQINKINTQIKKQGIGQKVSYATFMWKIQRHIFVNVQKIALEGCPRYQLWQLISGRGMGWWR